MEVLPNKFKQLKLESYNNVVYTDQEYDFSCLPNDYVAIKVLAAGYGPYDIGFIVGRLKSSIEKLNLGVEGVGRIVRIGNECDENLLGKRVGFLASHHDPKTIRAFSEYSIIKRENIVEIPDYIEDEQAAYLLGNPLTALCIFNSIIKNRKCKALVQDTASSALGKMITKLCISNGINIINIVRKDENIEMLSNIGSKYNFNSNSKNFNNEIKQCIDELNPSIYISYQGGEFPYQIFSKLPDYSVLIFAGNINNQKLSGFSSTDFIFNQKTIEGFQIMNYLNTITKEEKENMINLIINDFKNKNLYYTDISKVFTFEQFDEARKYYEENMSKGKIILKP